MDYACQHNAELHNIRASWGWAEEASLAKPAGVRQVAVGQHRANCLVAGLKRRVLAGRFVRRSACEARPRSLAWRILDFVRVGLLDA